MSTPQVISLIPYKILPAKMGGEKGIALFNEYLGKHVHLTGISTKGNDASLAKNYRFLNVLTDKRIRYANVLLYFKIRRLIRHYKATHLIIEHPYYGWLAYLLRKTMPITLIVHSHNIEFQRFQSLGRWWWQLLKYYEKWVYNISDINFFISEDDRQTAIESLRVEADKSSVITYGVEIAGIPQDRVRCKAEISTRHDIGPGEKILLFNGALSYSANFEALKVILEHINPLLLSKDIRYKILICGKGLPDSFNELKEYSDKNIIYAGFVDDISAYFKASDIFLNPVMYGGGVKTKLIEAIAYNNTVISTKTGATGIIRDVCGDKLSIIPDLDWTAFAEAIVLQLQGNAQTPRSFYDYYYWEPIAQKAASIISGQLHKNEENISQKKP